MMRVGHAEDAHDARQDLSVAGCVNGTRLIGVLPSVVARMRRRKQVIDSAEQAH